MMLNDKKYVQKIDNVNTAKTAKTKNTTLHIRDVCPYELKSQSKRIVVKHIVYLIKR